MGWFNHQLIVNTTTSERCLTSMQLRDAAGCSPNSEAVLRHENQTCEPWVNLIWHRNSLFCWYMLVNFCLGSWVSSCFEAFWCMLCHLHSCYPPESNMEPGKMVVGRLFSFCTGLYLQGLLGTTGYYNFFLSGTGTTSTCQKHHWQQLTLAALTLKIPHRFASSESATS